MRRHSVMTIIIPCILVTGCASVSPPAPARSVPCETLKPYEGPVTEWAIDYEIAYEVACGVKPK